MATKKQQQAARKNVKKAADAARSKKSISHLPKKTRTVLGKQGAAVAQRKRSVGSEPKTRRELYEEAKQKEPSAVGGIVARSRNKHRLGLRSEDV